jgi:tetratricopeptide (TPR) repeat protein
MNEQELLALHERVKTTPDFEAVERLIEYYDQYDNYEELEKLYDLALQFNPNDPKALNNLAVIHADYYGDFEKARYYYEKTLEIVPYEAHVQFNYAALLEFNFKEFELAKQHYVKAIEANPQYVDAYLNLSWLFLEQDQDVNSAYHLMRQAEGSIQTSWEIYTHLAYIEFNSLKEYQEAKVHCQKALELKPDSDLTYTYLGQISLLEQDHEQALIYFEAAVDTKKLNHILVFEYGKLLLMHYRDFDKAIDLLNHATTFFPDTALYPAYLANVYLLNGLLTEAKQTLEIAEERQEKSVDALLLIGYLKVVIDDDREDAMMYFEKVVELNPNNLNALSIVGFYHLFTNQQIDTALEYFKKITEISNQFYPAYFITAQIYAQYYEDYHQALTYYGKIDVNHLNKQDLAYLYYTMGEIYDKNLHDKQKALDFYELAYESTPSPALEAVIQAIYDQDKTLVN